jgi:hypothetical protein
MATPSSPQPEGILEKDLRDPHTDAPAANDASNADDAVVVSLHMS